MSYCMRIRKSLSWLELAVFGPLQSPFFVRKCRTFFFFGPGVYSARTFTLRIQGRRAVPGDPMGQVVGVWRVMDLRWK